MRRQIANEKVRQHGSAGFWTIQIAASSASPPSTIADQPQSTDAEKCENGGGSGSSVAAATDETSSDGAIATWHKAPLPRVALEPPAMPLLVISISVAARVTWFEAKPRCLLYSRYVAG